MGDVAEVVAAFAAGLVLVFGVAWICEERAARLRRKNIQAKDQGGNR